jgi:hypothetical protein
VYDYQDILAQPNDYPLIRIAYGPDETGWARRLDRRHALIANVSCTSGRCRRSGAATYEAKALEGMTDHLIPSSAKAVTSLPCER